MFKIELDKEEIKEAILDYYNGGIALAKKEAEALYEIAYKKLNEEDYEFYPQMLKKSEDDIRQISFLMKNIPAGLTKEEYVEKQVELTSGQINKKLVSGDLSGIKFPSKHKITIDKRLESDKEKVDRICDSIVAGVKKMNLLLGASVSLLGFSWPGIYGAFIATDTGTENCFFGYISGVILFSTLCNIPNIIKFIKEFTASYRKNEKLSFLSNYSQALHELSWIESFFKDLAKKFQSNISKIYDEIDIPKRR